MDRQELTLGFSNVQQLLFDNVFVEDTLRLSARSVKEISFVNSSFMHIPARGFEFENVDRLELRDNVFHNVQEQSIVVADTREVTVVGKRHFGHE